MFKIGDVVVYPIQGVARIVDIRNEKIGGVDQLCYILEAEIRTPRRPVIKLPVDKVEINRVREIVDETEIPNIIDILMQRDTKITAQTWNRRHREYNDKMRTGSIFQAAEVYRDLRILKENKELSHSERRLFDQAHNLLIKELSIAKKTDEKEIERTINEIFARGTSSDRKDEEV